MHLLLTMVYMLKNYLSMVPKFIECDLNTSSSGFHGAIPRYSVSFFDLPFPFSLLPCEHNPRPAPRLHLSTRPSAPPIDSIVCFLKPNHRLDRPPPPIDSIAIASS
ncbi:hypothetical protein L1887_03878 [Cichorium endivia]|nr:hypothetical protein L1887_03878 [Cichorium endivia]